MHPRNLLPALETALTDTPVVFLAGARQTGKSTLVQGLGRGSDYRTFDDLSVLAAAQADPVGFIDSLGPTAILDEIQRIPDLLLPIKASVDRDRRPGRFILTGSANVLALPKVAESLAGRMEVLTLWPLAQSERAAVRPHFVDACFTGHPEELRISSMEHNDLLERISAGGYPEAVARSTTEARTRWFNAYLQTLIQRDVRDLAAIEGLAQLPRLLSMVAARTGSPMNVADLGRTLGLSQVTLRRYLILFETLFLLVQLPPWYENLGKRLAKTPKVYLNDSGLLLHLLGADPEGLRHSPALGPIVESFAVMELIKTASWSRAQPSLFHLRTSTGTEVDVVLEDRSRRLVGIEVKASQTVGASDFNGLRMMKALVGDRFCCGVVLYSGKEVLPFGPGLWALPLQALWGEA
ncbi:MAG: ATP-binding protein [Acidobacteria bacterium]|nr:ATP-binding protein [Acidobacteriota bacterium]